MNRTLCYALIAFLLLTSSSFAGFYKSNYSSNYSRVVASVQIKEKGIYNLIVTVNFLRKAQDKKIYKSDGYGHLIDRLQIEWRDIAINKILESKEIEITELINLKNSI